jgi:hypothetical protein
MKDNRLKAFRTTLDAVTESLDALVRVARWSDATEAPPEPLRAAASKLVERLGAADRIASGAFVGSPADMTKVSAMCSRMRQLDLAYVAYRKRLESKAEGPLQAAAALEVDIAEATAVAID